MDKKNIVAMAVVVFSIVALFFFSSFNSLLILLIPLGLIAFSSLFFSRGILIFFTTLCLMVTQSRFIEIRSVTLSLRWVFFVLFFLHIFGDILLGRTVRNIKSFDISALLFIIFALFSTYYSINPMLTLERVVTIFLLYVSVFWIIWKYAYDQGPQKVVNLILQVFALILIGSYSMLFINPHRSFLSFRFMGIFNNPNSLGLICAMLLPLSLCKYLDSRKKFALFLFFIILFSLFFSGSRGSLNAMVFSMGYFIYVCLKKYKPLAFFSSLAVIFIFIWVIHVIAEQFFFSYLRVESISTGGGRFEVWPIALDLIRNKPIFGYGFGVEELLLKFKHIKIFMHPGGAFHNSYLGMALQLGILGWVIFYIPLFILLFKEVFSKYDSQPPLLRYALRASLIAGLFCGFFESFIYSVGNSQAFPFWVIVMLLTFYRCQSNRKTVPEST